MSGWANGADRGRNRDLKRLLECVSERFLDGLGRKQVFDDLGRVFNDLSLAGRLARWRERIGFHEGRKNHLVDLRHLIGVESIKVR